MIPVKIVNKSNNEIPQYATDLSSGVDLRAFTDEPITLKPMERKLIHTGLYMAFPPGYEAQVRPRSGLALKKGITVLNTPGTIDADYRGEVGIILFNTSDEDFEVNFGDRIAQIVLNKVEQIEWEEVDELDETERGEGGFGHTQIN